MDEASILKILWSSFSNRTKFTPLTDVLGTAASAFLLRQIITHRTVMTQNYDVSDDDTFVNIYILEWAPSV
jgi:hypothetical protein